MKIAFAIGSLSGGGAERVVSEIASEMAERGHDVSVILIAMNKITYEISEKVNIIDCSKNYQSLGFIRRVTDIRRQIRHINPDVLVSFTVAVNIYAILSCLLLPVKLIIAERNDPRYDPQSKLFRAARKVLYSFADGYVFQTNGEKEYFSQGIQRKSIVIPNPVNPNLPEIYSGERSKRFVAAARLAPQKNLKMAIDAFEIVSKKHDAFIFEIYGQGPMENELKKYIADKDLQEKVLLKGNSNQLYKDILDAYAFVLSSDYEGISNSMLEAMALGIPTISTDYPSGGARENIINKQNGLLVSVNGVKELEEAMDLLIEFPEMATEIGKQGAKIRKNLSVDKITRIWVEYLEK